MSHALDNIAREKAKASSSNCRGIGREPPDANFVATDALSLRLGMNARFARLISTIAVLIVSGCERPAIERHPMPGADAARGREIIMNVGCASCHIIPGVNWPKGRVGPSLAGFASRPLIAGGHPNDPLVLAEFVRNAPAYIPHGGMPPMPLNEEEARDVAAYLYTLEPE